MLGPTKWEGEKGWILDRLILRIKRTGFVKRLG